MKLYIFNPGHDHALASGLTHFTAPHAARQLRADLGFMPALWASEDGCVLVDDSLHAKHSWQRMLPRLAKLGVMPYARIDFIEPSSLKAIRFDSIDPWGWNATIKSELLRYGVAEPLLPSDSWLENARTLSHRYYAAMLLLHLRFDATVGEAFRCFSLDEVLSISSRLANNVVLKAPWSGSGRGVRFLSSVPDTSTTGWISNVIKAQGSIMLEPYYNKVKDFGMEFFVDTYGHTHYLGLSLFHTINGAYAGNILATEEEKRVMLGAYLSTDLLDKVATTICQHSMRGYVGPFGVDMMVVRDLHGFLLHPCVEINLRRTMGHVALHASPIAPENIGMMRIAFNAFNYKLLFSRSNKLSI